MGSHKQGHKLLRKIPTQRDKESVDKCTHALYGESANAQPFIEQRVSLIDYVLYYVCYMLLYDGAHLNLKAQPYFHQHFG